mgnify:CR=1 FL=1
MQRAHTKGTKKRFNLLIRARAFYDEFTDDTAYQRRTFTRVFIARDAKDAKVAKRTKNNNFTYINDLWSR